jgi:NOL1/NOP2/sun family putative RNA methylase
MREPFPNADDIVFKEKFIERYSQLTDWDTFKTYSLSFLRRSIRVNTLKITPSAIKKRLHDWHLTPIPWCTEGFWVSHAERRDIGNTLEHHLGYIYVQEAASMIPPLILDPQPGDIVLDMCAAPGSKTSQMAQMMNNTGLIVANDYRGKRLQPLGINLQRTGATNTLITLMAGQRLRHFQFDRILVDAPCSGTGTIRKSVKTIRMWNPGMVKKIAREQQQLITNAFRNLKPGGVLVYSTCSLEPEENEGVVNYLLNTFANAQVENATLNGLKSSPPVLKFEGQQYHKDISRCLRIWPQDNDTEGFFVAKVRKLPATE